MATGIAPRYKRLATHAVPQCLFGKRPRASAAAPCDGRKQASTLQGLGHSRRSTCGHRRQRCVSLLLVTTTAHTAKAMLDVSPCTTSERVVMRQCSGRQATGLNLTLHVPVMAFAELIAFISPWRQAALRHNGGFMRFEELLVTVDTRNKSEAGAAAACAQAAADARQYMLTDDHRLNDLTRCMEVRAVPYRFVGPTRRALETVFGPFARAIPYNDEQQNNHAPMVYKTSMQFWSLFSNAWRLRTRFVAHMDADAIMLPLSPFARVSALEAFLVAAIRTLRTSPSTQLVMADQCRMPSSCESRCGARPSSAAAMKTKVPLFRRLGYLSTEVFAGDVLRWTWALSEVRMHTKNSSHAVAIEASQQIEHVLHRWFQRVGEGSISSPAYSTTLQGQTRDAPAATLACHTLGKWLQRCTPRGNSALERFGMNAELAADGKAVARQVTPTAWHFLSTSTECCMLDGGEGCRRLAVLFNDSHYCPRPYQSMLRRRSLHLPEQEGCEPDEWWPTFGHGVPPNAEFGRGW